MRVWIDFSNSPHPLLFAPVVRALASDGHQVLLTARNNAQTVELARQRWPDTSVIGGPSPRGRRAKAVVLGERIASLRRWARAARPDVALSHNSYAQIVAARSLGIPPVTAMDFEHQPANHVAFRLAHTVVVPDLFPSEGLRRQGARPHKVVRYAGLKEELYIGDFEPDPQILEKLGLAPRPEVLAVLRTPPSRAIYHSQGNPLFDRAVRVLCDRPEVTAVLLARHPEQTAAIRSQGLTNCIVPATAIDSRSLVYAADVVVGAGGTMTREAALMGLPTWTLFSGRRPAVDEWLESQGVLSRLTDPNQLARVGARAHEPHPPEELRERSQPIADAFLAAILGAATARGGHRRPR